MNIKYIDKEKQEVIQKDQNGISVATLVVGTGIPRSTIYSWIKAEQAKGRLPGK